MKPKYWIGLNGILCIISSPELKARVSFSDQNLSLVRGCRCWRFDKLFTFLSSSPKPLD